jgi:hypothetical protein
MTTSCAAVSTHRPRREIYNLLAAAAPLPRADRRRRPWVGPHPARGSSHLDAGAVTAAQATAEAENARPAGRWTPCPGTGRSCGGCVRPSIRYSCTTSTLRLQFPGSDLRRARVRDHYLAAWGQRRDRRATGLRPSGCPHFPPPPCPPAGGTARPRVVPRHGCYECSACGSVRAAGTSPPSGTGRDGRPPGRLRQAGAARHAPGSGRAASVAALLGDVGAEAGPRDSRCSLDSPLPGATVPPG